MEEVKFTLGPLSDNSEGWGPSAGSSAAPAIPGVPFLPYSKNEKLGRVADWAQGRTNSKPSYHRREHYGGDDKDNPFDYFYTEDDSDFRVVDKKVGQPKSYRSFRGQRYARYDRQRRNAQMAQRKLEKKKYGRHYETRRKRGRVTRWNRNRHHYWYQQKSITRRPSIKPKADWEVVATVPLDDFGLYIVENVPRAQTILKCGGIRYFNTDLDLVSAKTKVTLKPSTMSYFKVTTTDDPVIRKLSTKFKANVYITDAILALLMCAPRTKNSWDIIVRRVGSKLFFDKRDASPVDFQPVNETGPEQPSAEKANINSPERLSMEATFVHQKFVHESLMMENEFKFSDKPSPFKGSGPDAVVAPVGYMYRKFELAGGNVVVCRCEVDGVEKDRKTGQERSVTVRTLTEHDPLGTSKTSGADWRMKIDTQRGGLLANELKNQNNVLAQMAAQMMLSGTQALKLGFASRVSPKDPSRHVLLGVMSFTPREFAEHVDLQPVNAWGGFEFLVDTCLALDEGTYLLFKEPNEQTLKLFSCPGDSPFEELDEDEHS